MLAQGLSNLVSSIFYKEKANSFIIVEIKNVNITVLIFLLTFNEEAKETINSSLQLIKDYLIILICTMCFYSKFT